MPWKETCPVNERLSFISDCLAREWTMSELCREYGISRKTGYKWLERFRDGGIEPDHFPGVLVANHGPFAWGKTAAKAVEHAIMLEEIARMAAQTEAINPQIGPVSQALLDKHFLRKHGPDAYYGQSSK